MGVIFRLIPLVAKLPQRLKPSLNGSPSARLKPCPTHFPVVKSRVAIMIVALAGLLATGASAQSNDDISLGDLARQLRKAKEPAAPMVVDNDNLSKVIDDIESHRITDHPLFSFDGLGKTFQMSSSDGTCNLSFNANATSLISTPYVSEDLPQEELAKLDGPATINDDALQVSIYNGTNWNLKEITVSLTIVRHSETDAAQYAAARLLPAATVEAEMPAEKHADTTMLLHLKGTAIPLATTVFREKLATLPGDQEWHWAIVDAKGIPPTPLAAASSQ
jgi:hypothetical protein